MIKWIKRERGEPITYPQEDGQYLTFNVAPQWDSEWYDVGIYSNGVFQRNFLIRPTFSVDCSVRWWAKLNNPARMPEDGRSIKVDPGVVDWVEIQKKVPSGDNDGCLIYSIGGQYCKGLGYDIRGHLGVEWVDIGVFEGGGFYGQRFRGRLSPDVGTWWYLELNDPTDVL